MSDNSNVTKNLNSILEDMKNNKKVTKLIKILVHIWWQIYKHKNSSA